jgi:hypothetical protein
MSRKKTPDTPVKKSRNVAAKNLADPRYRARVVKNPDTYTRKPRNRPGKGARLAPSEGGDDV